MSDYVISFDGQEYPTDKQGFLKKRLTWSQPLAHYISTANEDGDASI